MSLRFLPLSNGLRQDRHMFLFVIIMFVEMIGVTATDVQLSSNGVKPGVIIFRIVFRSLYQQSYVVAVVLVLDFAVVDESCRTTEFIPTFYLFYSSLCDRCFPFSHSYERQ